MTNFSDKSYRRKKTHFMFKKPLTENFAFDEIMWENTVEPDRPQII